MEYGVYAAPAGLSGKSSPGSAEPRAPAGLRRSCGRDPRPRAARTASPALLPSPAGLGCAPAARCEGASARTGRTAHTHSLALSPGARQCLRTGAKRDSEQECGAAARKGAVQRTNGRGRGEPEAEAQAFVAWLPRGLLGEGSGGGSDGMLGLAHSSPHRGTQGGKFPQIEFHLKTKG